MAQKNSHKLGLITLIALVAGNMVGSGVWMLPAQVAQIGSIGLLAWIVTGFGALLLAFVFAKMSLLVPNKNGGPYAYARAGFGECVGFQTGCYYWIATVVGNVAVLVALMGYLQVFFPILKTPVVETSAAIAILWILTGVNIAGVRGVGVLQLITTSIKFIPIIVISIVGWFYFHPEYITSSFNVSSKTNFSAFSYAATLTFWAFVGVESATVPSGLVHNPEKNIPRSTLFGTLLAIFVYLFSATVIAGMIPVKVLAQSTSPFALACEMVFGHWGSLVVAAIIVIALFGTLNGWTLIVGQVSMAIAEDELFPKMFAKRNRQNIPAIGIIIASLLMTVLLIVVKDLNLVAQFQLLAVVTATASLITYFYTAVAEVIILRREKRLARKNIFHLVIAVLAAIYAFWAIFGSGEEVIFYIAAFVFLTIPFYALVLRKKR